MRKKSTIYDIASDTGFSIATVSKVLNRKGGYSSETEARVLDSMDKLAYTPSKSAKSLALNHTQVIGYASAVMNNSFESGGYSMQMLSGLAQEAVDHDYDVLLDARLMANLHDARRWRQSRQRYDALVVSSVSGPIRDRIVECLREGFPVVYAGFRIEEDTEGCNVYGGYEHYKMEALEMFHRLGHRNIVLLEGYAADDTFLPIERCRGIIERFRTKTGMNETNCRLIPYDINNYAIAEKLIEDIVSKAVGTFPLALYVDNSYTSVLAYNVIHRMNLRIPQDISLLSTSHNARAGEEFSPPLSTVHVNAYEMGRRAAQMLIARLQDTPQEMSHDIPYQFIQRGSIMEVTP